MPFLVPQDTMAVPVPGGIAGLDCAISLCRRLGPARIVAPSGGVPLESLRSSRDCHRGDIAAPQNPCYCCADGLADVS